MRELGSFKRLIVLGFSLITIAFETLIYAWFWLNDLGIQIRPHLWYTFKGHALTIGVYAMLLFAFSSMYGGLKVGYLKTSEVVFSQVFSTLIVNAVTYCQDSLMYWGLMNPSPFLKMTIYQCIGVFCWSMIAQKLYRFLFAPRKMLLIHGDRPHEELIRKFGSRDDKYDICKSMHISAGMDAICKEIVERYDAIVLGDIDVASRNALYKFCYGKGIRVYILPKISDVLLAGSEEMHIFDTPIFLTREFSLTIEQRFFKRAIDVVCSAILLVMASPIMLLTAIAIKLYDGGPVIYKQVRCTKDMREFGIMKFRSMRVDAEKDGVARLATKNDSRITPIGKFIRKVRIDELPQLINILKGDMSFIGPRPERPEIVAQYVEIMPEFVFRTKVKAGLAGYAQVYGKYNTTPYDKLKLDLTYIENYSVWMDIKLMLLTLKILFWPDSTEGVETQQVTAFKEEYQKRGSEEAESEIKE